MTLIRTLGRNCTRFFVALRVTSWIVSFAAIRTTIHERTRSISLFCSVVWPHWSLRSSELCQEIPSLLTLLIVLA